jgi:hypothetical protein
MNFDPIIPEHLRTAKNLYSRLQPGQEIRVAAMLLSQAALDHYLSGVCSGYTLGYRLPGACPNDWALFRLAESLENDPRNRRSYVDPDRRHLYDYQHYTGLYIPKP